MIRSSEGEKKGRREKLERMNQRKRGYKKEKRACLKEFIRRRFGKKEGRGE